MKRILLATILCLFMLGCRDNSDMKIPKGNQGSASQQEIEKKKISGEIKGSIKLPEPVVEDPEDLKQPWVIKVDGVDVQVPYGTKGEFEVKTVGSSSLDSFTEMVSSWKLNSAPVQLFIFGGILVAVGVVLIIFGMVKVGIMCIGAGFALITCGVLINQYPWIFLIVFGVGAIAGIYFIYIQFKKKSTIQENTDQQYVLEKLVDLVARLPEEFQEKYFKQPLKEDDQSAMVRRITRKARGLTE